MSRIPKTIHYCWIGGPKTQLTIDCVKSWERNLKDYEIIEWNEGNFDVFETEFAKRCYDAGIYSFVSDFVRAKVLYEHGGVYLDADMEVLPGKNFDSLLDNEAFIGFQYPWPPELPDSIVNNRIGFGAIGSVKNGSFAKDLLSCMNSAEVLEDLDLTNPNLEPITVDHWARIFKRYGLKEYGLQMLNDVKILPKEYFGMGHHKPEDADDIISEETICVHYGALSWQSALREHNLPFFRRVVKKVFAVLGVLKLVRYIRDLVVRK